MLEYLELVSVKIRPTYHIVLDLRSESALGEILSSDRAAETVGRLRPASTALGPVACFHKHGLHYSLSKVVPSAADASTIE